MQCWEAPQGSILWWERSLGKSFLQEFVFLSLSCYLLLDDGTLCFKLTYITHYGTFGSIQRPQHNRRHMRGCPTFLLSAIQDSMVAQPSPQIFSLPTSQITSLPLLMIIITISTHFFWVSNWVNFSNKNTCNVSNPHINKI